ncbi:PucR family transcriptional regulator [Vibrio hippocampi]|uniref:PucR family transcriptional regulator n=1 Tax=Vibrio hippocampi TaxID=654686 RepID=A0ABM8ZHQ1_9VIBR|nr:PucR family transcriptional regulator [Vibrio hippocampi]CAH0525803.1 hypothetical protein VHP8226_01334 [Vibrio hippocampi]
MIKIDSLAQLQGLDALNRIAGHQGKDNVIRWPYIAENLDIEPWTKGGELVFVTGLNWDWLEADFIELLNRGLKCSISGLVILTGSPYISSISAKVKQHADALGIPLIEQPYSLPMVTVTELISNAIIMDDLEHKSIKWFIQYLADCPRVSEVDMEKATELGLCLNQPYSVAFLRLQNQQPQQSVKVHYLIEQFIQGQHSPFPLVEYQHGWLAILPLANQRGSEIAQWRDLITELKVQQVIAKVGVCSLSNLMEFPHAVRKAKQSIDFAQSDGVMHYDELGIAQLFTQVEDKQVLDHFCQQQLGEVFRLNEDEQIEMLQQTVLCYFDNLCSLRQTASELEIHRNTLTKRLDKFEALTGKDLSNAHQRLSIQVALVAQRFFNN